jgi:GT2 family glycosyltransferase
MDLSIISVNWNSLDYLRECITSIYQWVGEISYEVIVVDNASPADDVDCLKQQFPALKVIKSKENLGFAGANNLGFRHSLGRCVLFLNPDTKLVSPAINVMLRAFYSLPQPGAVGCKLLNADLSVQTSSIMKFPRILNTILQVEYLRLRWPRLWGIAPLFSTSHQPVEVEAISGACMLIRRDTFEKVGMFSEDYFMYSEDLDLCYRMTRAGFKNYYVGQGAIVHYGGRSSTPKWQTVMKTRAELRFCDKSYGRLYGLLFRIALALNAIARLLVVDLLRVLRSGRDENEKLNSAAARWRAILAALLTEDSAAVAPITSDGISSCGVAKA